MKNPYLDHKFICVKYNYSTNSKKNYTKHCTTKNIKIPWKSISKMLNFLVLYVVKRMFRRGLSV